MKAYLEIEMPKDGCTHCPLARRGSIFSRICVITEEYVDGNYERGGFPTECPLQELQPHGRLIDASETVRVQMYDEEHEDWYTEEMTIDDLLGQGWIDAEAPTIIPESEEG